MHVSTYYRSEIYVKKLKLFKIVVQLVRDYIGNQHSCHPSCAVGEITLEINILVIPIRSCDL